MIRIQPVKFIDIKFSTQLRTPLTGKFKMKDICILHNENHDRILWEMNLGRVGISFLQNQTLYEWADNQYTYIAIILITS